MPEFTTDLAFSSGIDLSPYSARGLSQTLDPIGQASNIARTINGGLIDLGLPQFRKYKSTITCTDQNVPALDGIFPGATVTIDCIATLSYKTSGGSPAKTVVSGSSYVEGDFTIYRPQITFMVMDYTISHDEYGAAIAWSLQLEEI